MLINRVLKAEDTRKAVLCWGLLGSRRSFLTAGRSCLPRIPGWRGVPECWALGPPAGEEPMASRSAGHWALQQGKNQVFARRQGHGKRSSRDLAVFLACCILTENASVTWRWPECLFSSEDVNSQDTGGSDRLSPASGVSRCRPCLLGAFQGDAQEVLGTTRMGWG